MATDEYGRDISGGTRKFNFTGGEQSSITPTPNESEGGGPTGSPAGAIPIYRYPIYLDSPTDMEGPFKAVQECIHFSAAKQGGISLQGQEHEANSKASVEAAQQKALVRHNERAQRIINSKKGTGKDASEADRQKYEAAMADIHGSHNGKAGRSDKEKIAEAYDVRDAGGSILSTQGKNMKMDEKILEHCFLYMPNSVTYAEGANWGAEELGAIGNFVKQGLTGKGGGIDDMLKAFAGGSVGAIATAASTALGAMAGGAGGALGAFMGAGAIGGGLRAAGRFATNPYEEQMFNGIPFRSFSFEFAFAPASEPEGKMVENIIKMFRKHSRPGYVGGIMGEGMFSFPNEFKIDFKKNMNGALVPNDDLPKIHNCVCTNVSTNYTPEGFWVALRDGKPLAYTLGLTFNETVKITQKDVEGGW